MKNKETSKIKYWIIIPIAIFLISRLLPFVIHGSHPLGYDTGFYYHSLQEQRQALDDHGLLGNIKQINNNLDVTENIGSRFINNILIEIGLTNQAILYWFYILLGLASGILIYLISKKYWGQYPALLSFLLYSLSTIQYTAFTNMLWKNSLGVFLVLLSLYLIEINQEKKQYYLTICFTSLISFTLIFIHRSSAFILITCLGLYTLLSPIKKIYKSYLIVGIIILITILLGLNYEQLINAYNNHDRFNLQSGNFINWTRYLIYSITYLPLAGYTLWQSYKQKKYNTIITLFLVSLVLTIMHFIFYQRLFIFLDLAVIILAGPAISKLGTYFKIKIKTSLIICSIFYITIFSYPLISYQPMITTNRLKDIQELNNLANYIRIFTDQAEDISWLYGFSGHIVIGPGWYDIKRPTNNWNYERWQLYWHNDIKVKEQFLKELDYTIIINNQEELQNINKNCIEQFNSTFAIFKCP